MTVIVKVFLVKDNPVRKLEDGNALDETASKSCSKLCGQSILKFQAILTAFFKKYNFQT